ncbi:MAG: tetratricopeptide repeat protein [Sphingobacteriales bacterium]|nr:tetratricopeptide repeat protein [Sphingobacteriales bacterium]MBI3717332.1 tetratricopeptide repeat protein [Sphingobacteriales bacterium]
MKKILLVALLFSSVIATGQKIKSQVTYRILQTANTLLEAQQLDAAEEYYKTGLKRAKADFDYYCQALAYQGMGTLYAKLAQKDKAIECYKNAISIYRAQKQMVIASVVENLLKSVQGIGDLYAGIEVGARGIKMSVIDVKLSQDREFDYTLIMDTSINTDAASLSYQSEKETTDAIAVYWGIIKNRLKISPKHVYIVISSGLKQELDKYNKIEYFAKVIRPKDLDTVIKVRWINAQEESELSLLGIVPQKHRYTTDQLDVGSGNTKGGYFNVVKNFIPVTFPVGTKSFQRLLESKTNKDDLNDYVKEAEKIWKDSLYSVVSGYFTDKIDFKQRDILYLSGGIVWSITSLTYPQRVNDNYVELKQNDITAFRNNLINNYDKITQPDYSLVVDYKIAEAAKKNIAQVLKTYDRKAMIAGTIWLDELIKEVNTIKPDKKIIFPKYAYMGWISGYLIKKVTRQYTGFFK